MIRAIKTIGTILLVLAGLCVMVAGLILSAMIGLVMTLAAIGFPFILAGIIAFWDWLLRRKVKKECRKQQP